ncbi:MAG: D-2-hydroxyacid dehydrogenase [Saprospiraceae bacterium]|nr:D-2-hydroxyacid dehydrogenase [Saprospiraceae bacterium]
MTKKLKIVVTDGFALSRNDLSWIDFEALGEVCVYDYTAPHELLERAKEADILIVNKTVLTAETIQNLPNLAYIGVTATGYNNVNTQAAAARHIPVCNVAGYGSRAVAQHVFALILALTNQVAVHHEAVQKGEWGAQPHFCIAKTPLIELSGKTLGIYGFSGIGREVAKIGQAFGMNIIVHRRNMSSDTEGGIRYVALDDLLAQSDFLSLNASLSHDNQGLINLENLKKMKPNAFLINTARGGFIVESDLKTALENGIIAGAALDVLSIEPPTEGSILFGVKNCLITPHNAWAAFEARKRLMHLTIENLKAFLTGKPQNVVNGQ